MNKLTKAECVQYAKKAKKENRVFVYEWLRDWVNGDEITTLHGYKHCMERHPKWSIDVDTAIRFALMFAMTKQSDPSGLVWSTKKGR